MTAQSVLLPSFGQPPVSEVVVAVTFPNVGSLTTLGISDFWRQELSQAFPQTEEHPPYVPPIERFDSGNVGTELAFTFGEAMPSPRLWFISEDGQELIQLQRDWFACNWRKVRPDDAYGRWPKRREAFVRWFGKFEQYVVAAGLGSINVTQCEVTYVNQIVVGGIWHQHGELNKVLTLAGDSRGTFLPQAEQVQLAARYLIRDESDQPVGRLHVSAQPALRREDSAPIFVVNLTARGGPEGIGLEGVLAFLDRGREWIVRGFADVTTPEMQKEWGLEQS